MALAPSVARLVGRPLLVPRPSEGFASVGNVVVRFQLKVDKGPEALPRPRHKERWQDVIVGAGRIETRAGPQAYSVRRLRPEPENGAKVD